MKKLIIIAITIALGVIIALSIKPKGIKTVPLNTNVSKSPIEKVNPASLPANTTADRVLIEKGKRRLTLFNQNKPLKSYQIALGREPNGKKVQEGDGRTPEGVYTIDRRKPNSNYHRALHISYPNPMDRADAKARGVSPGGDIMIHGLPNGMGFIGSLHTQRDWTLGCIALTNPEIDEIWRAVPDGTSVEIIP